MCRPLGLPLPLPLPLPRLTVALAAATAVVCAGTARSAWRVAPFVSAVAEPGDPLGSAVSLVQALWAHVCTVAGVLLLASGGERWWPGGWAGQGGVVRLGGGGSTPPWRGLAPWGRCGRLLGWFH